MLYINRPGLRDKAITYNDLVSLTIQSGIDPKRAYMYLAGIGVRGELTRIMPAYGENDYNKPVKMAVYGHIPSFVTSAKICTKCQRLSIDFA